MTAGAGARLVGGALVAALLGACQPETVVIQRPPVPDQPGNVDRVGAAVVVGQGQDPELGGYRAWVYRTRDGATCFEVATQGMSSTGCGPGADAVVGISAYETDGGWFVVGSTDQPAASAVVHLADGGQVRGAVTAAAPGLVGGLSFLVIPVTAGPPASVDLLDAEGSVLESVEVTP
jgi:hypothetical protein